MPPFPVFRVVGLAYDRLLPAAQYERLLYSSAVRLPQDFGGEAQSFSLKLFQFLIHEHTKDFSVSGRGMDVFPVRRVT